MNKLLPYLIGGIFVAAVAVVVGKALAPAPAMTAAPMGHMMQTPDLSKIPAGAPIVTVRVPASLDAEATMGKRAFDANCAACHGANAAGVNGDGPPLVHPFYRPGHHPDAAFYAAAQNGVQAHHWTFGNMPPVSGVTRADVKAIIAYVRSLQRANGID